MSNTTEILIKDKFGLKLYKPQSVTLHTGLTILSGCNGAGKSSLLNEIHDYVVENKIDHVYLDCNESFHVSDIQMMEKTADIMTHLQKAWRSEYENYSDLFNDWIRTVRPPDSMKGKSFFVIIDGLDSGSDTHFQKMHAKLFKLMCEDATKRGIDIYLVVSCNNFYYLAADYLVGKNIQCPSLESFDLPKYKLSEFSRYIEDIEKSLKERGFI